MQQLTLAAEAVPLNPRDLPTYAGALFDYFALHTDRYRFLSWGRLELVRNSPPETNPSSSWGTDPYSKSMINKVGTLRHAQQAGHLDPTWDPADILALVSQIAFTNIGQPERADLAQRVAADTSTSARRAAVVRAIRTLFPPAP